MKKRILLIGTGGTIASEETGNGLSPELTGYQLLQSVPNLFSAYQVECVQLLNLDSTNIEPKHWLLLAGTIQRRYAEFDGFVISHGTDTMAYTAAALSYLIQGSGKPIVLTGAQKPIGFETTDSKQNLRDAFTVAASDLSGVMLVFNGKIILGTRARKTRSKSFEAFSSINFPLLGTVQDGRLFCYLHQHVSDALVFYDRIDPKVALMKLIPGTGCGVVKYLLDRHDALVIESFGVGGLPVYESGDFFEAVRDGLDAGKTVVMTTQVANEGSDLSVYYVGQRLKKNLPVLEAYDMTTEAATTKLMWILGFTSDPMKVKDLFYTPVSFDILSYQ